MEQKEQKVLIVRSKNVTPEEELRKKLRGLGREWRIISASTSLVPWGSWNRPMPECGLVDSVRSPIHVFYVTTVVLEKIEEGGW